MKVVNKTQALNMVQKYVKNAMRHIRSKNLDYSDTVFLNKTFNALISELRKLNYKNLTHQEFNSKEKLIKEVKKSRGRPRKYDSKEDVKRIANSTEVKKLKEFPINPKILTILSKANIRTLEDLSKHSESSLKMVKYVGDKYIDELKKCLPKSFQFKTDGVKNA